MKHVKYNQVFVAVVLFINLLQLQGVHCQNLTAIELSTGFPFARYGTASAYDGNNTIYFFGGLIIQGSDTSYPIGQVLKFDIPSETFEIVANMSSPTAMGSAYFDSNGDIYYLSAYNGPYLYRFSPATNAIIELPKSSTGWVGMYFSNSIIKKDDKILVFGSTPERLSVIREIDTRIIGPVELNTVGELPFGFYDGCATFFNDTSVLIFPGREDRRKVGLYNTVTGQTTILGDNHEPTDRSIPVSDGKFVYLVGGLRQDYGATRMDGLFQFDPLTGESKFLLVNNFPGRGRRFQFTSASYVPSLDRIYIFGGWDLTYDGPVATSWYIDLQPIRNTQ